MARADEYLVKVYLRDQLIKTHPRQRPGGRSTDAADMPPGVEGYATRTVDRMVAQAGCYGEHVGIYAQRLLDGDAPWMMMRSVYRLVGLAKRYGPRRSRGGLRPGPGRRRHQCLQDRVDAEERHREEHRRLAAAAATAGAGRFARDPAEYATATGVRLQVVDGGSDRWRRRPDLPAAQREARSLRGGCRSFPSPVFFSFLFFSRAEKKKKGL